LKKRHLKWPAYVWLLITTILLTLPGSTLPSEKWLSDIEFDKIVHIGLFGVMVVLWCRAFSDIKEKKIGLFILIAICSFLFGILMEFVQKYFIPGRSYDIMDILADGAGSIAGLVTSFKLYIKK
jgi:VanZ family protein